MLREAACLQLAESLFQIFLNLPSFWSTLNRWSKKDLFKADNRITKDALYIISIWKDCAKSLGGISFRLMIMSERACRNKFQLGKSQLS